ncbi:MFS transporter [Metasolibacillus sp. FSL H7-0170]|uniref:MFS transporter n=1 Tax=Metasolibacillus sp. FSL H7-0170 TaxID=2921431 RepID=UPI0031581EDC
MENTHLKRHRDKLLITLMFTLIISVMNATAFNIVIPQVSEAFRMTTAQGSWITSIYILVFAIGTVIYGKLADIYKLKNLVTVGFILCAVGSIIGASAQVFPLVLTGRFIQAAGASVSPAIAMIIPVRYFSQEERGRALGIASIGTALGSVVGPIVSALTVSVFGWRWLFYISILFLFTIPFFRKYLEDDQKKRTRFDWQGGGIFAAAIALVMLSITKEVWQFALIGIVMLSLFIIRIHLAADPFIQPTLLKNKRYTLGLAIAFLTNGTGYSIFFLSPLLLFNVNHLDPGLIGLTMVPAALVTALFSFKSGKLADTKGNAYVFNIGTALLVTFFLLVILFVGASHIFISLFLIFGNLGHTFITIALFNAISRTLSAQEAGLGMGLLAMLNFISNAIAAAIFSKMVDMQFLQIWNPLNHSQNSIRYSNIFLCLLLLQIGIFLYYSRWSKHEKEK